MKQLTANCAGGDVQEGGAWALVATSQQHKTGSDLRSSRISPGGLLGEGRGVDPIGGLVSRGSMRLQRERALK